MKRVDVRIHGRVQGVGFRAFVRREAEARRISGYVENCLDGSVHALLAGEADAVREMTEALRSGPPGARVTECTVTDTDAIPETDKFVVRR